MGVIALCHQCWWCSVTTPTNTVSVFWVTITKPHWVTTFIVCFSLKVIFQLNATFYINLSVSNMLVIEHNIIVTAILYICSYMCVIHPGQKYKMAQKWGSISIVSPLWIFDCEQLGYRVAEDSSKYSIRKASTPSKEECKSIGIVLWDSLIERVFYQKSLSYFN